MPTTTRLVFVACLAAVLCSGCGSSAAPGAPATDGVKKGSVKAAGSVPPHDQTPTPTVAKVTFHVKDMGKRLNLL